MSLLHSNQELAGRFAIQHLLGESAFGEKYLAFDQLRDEAIALKVLSQDILADSGGVSGVRETLNQLTHLAVPGIARIYDYGVYDQHLFVTMEYVTASSFDEWLKPLLSESELLTFFGNLAEQLNAGQSFGPHLGLKPSNLFVSPSHTPILTDYGINRLVSAQKRRTVAMLNRDRQFLPPEFFLEAPTSSQAIDAFGLGALWLSALQNISRDQGTPSERQTKKWLPQLTHSDARLRTTDFGRIARDLTRSRPFSVPGIGITERTGQRTRLKRVMALSFLVTFLMMVSWWFNERRNTTTSRPQISRATIAQHLQSAEYRRMDLIRSVQTHPSTRQVFMPSLTEPVLMDHARALTAVDPEQADSLIGIQQALRSYDQRLALIEALSFQLPSIVERTDLANLITEGPFPLAQDTVLDWHDAYRQISQNLNRSELDVALHQAKSLNVALSTTLSNHWTKAYQATRSARQGWIDSLARRGLQHVEPGEDLSGQLKPLARQPNPESFPEALDEMQTLKTKWEYWTAEHNNVPDPTPLHFVNSIDMRFVRVGDLLVSIWETRAMDFALHILETGLERRYYWREYAALGGPTHPVTRIGQLDATIFCKWLTERDRKLNKIGPKDTYRLPTDREWSLMAGLTDEGNADPLLLSGQPNKHVPWHPPDLPLKRRGNYFTWPREPLPNEDSQGYDIFHRTSPAGWFQPNALGIFDLAGNVREWTSTTDVPNRELNHHHVLFIVRGAGWLTSSEHKMKSHYRSAEIGSHRSIGFRVVLELANIPKHEHE